MNIVLHEPENPLNAGNIGRTCAVTGSALHLIRPLGFFTGAKEIKRAGLDYWDSLNVSYYDNYNEFMKKNGSAVIYYASTKAEKTYAEVGFGPDDFIMFGKESAGIPEDILAASYSSCIRIPMLAGSRSLNLATSVGIVLYEALRQNGFCDLKKSGELGKGNSVTYTETH